jgi:hypothetical protein
MPKSAGSDPKPAIRAPSRPLPPSRSIMHQTAPAPGPHHNPPATTPPTASNDLAAATVRAAKNPGGIDVRKRYDDPGNIN